MLAIYLRSINENAARDLIECRLQDGGKIHFHIRQNSMLPMLQSGDEITVVGVPADCVKIGSLVVLFRKNSWIVHRLLYKSQEAYGWRLITKGDHVWVTDPIWKNITWVGLVQEVRRDRRHLDLTTPEVQRFERVAVLLSRFEYGLSVGSPGRLSRGFRYLPRWFFTWLVRRVWDGACD